MKRLNYTLLPSQLYAYSKPVGATLLFALNYVWVWCLNVDHMLKRQRTRIDLESLTDEQLQDIGLTRSQVLMETRKKFWQD